MTGNCGYPEGVEHLHVERCYEGGRRDALAEVGAAVRAALPNLCFITRSDSPLRCTSWIDGTFTNGAEFTIEMCCVPCRVRLALDDATKDAQ